MGAAIHHIQTANEELAKLQSEVFRLEQRIQTLQRTLGEATEAVTIQERRPLPSRPQTPMAHQRLIGEPLKTSAEMSVRVQQILGLETKKEAEIAMRAVIDALEETLLNNLPTDGFSLKLGGFGKFKVHHLKPTIRRVGFSGEMVTTKARRKVKFVPLGMLRACERVS